MLIADGTSAASRYSVAKNRFARLYRSLLDRIPSLGPHPSAPRVAHAFLANSTKVVSGERNFSFGWTSEACLEPGPSGIATSVPSFNSLDSPRENDRDRNACCHAPFCFRLPSSIPIQVSENATLRKSVGNSRVRIRARVAPGEPLRCLRSTVLCGAARIARADHDTPSSQRPGFEARQKRWRFDRPMSIVLSRRDSRWSEFATLICPAPPGIYLKSPSIPAGFNRQSSCCPSSICRRRPGESATRCPFFGKPEYCSLLGTSPVESAASAVSRSNSRVLNALRAAHWNGTPAGHEGCPLLS